MLQETHSHVEKELEGYRSKVSLATAELDAIEATIHLLSVKSETLRTTPSGRARLSQLVALLARYLRGDPERGSVATKVNSDALPEKP